MEEIKADVNRDGAAICGNWHPLPLPNDLNIVFYSKKLYVYVQVPFTIFV